MDPELSKSARKREALRLQELGRTLTELNAEQLTEVPMEPVLREAIALHNRIHSNGAKRRQLQYIGRLMRDSDVDAIQAEIDRLSGESASAQYTLHLVERWRERLLAEPQALTEFLAEFAQADRQRLRHLIGRTNSARNADQQRKFARELFRLLRETVEQREPS